MKQALRYVGWVPAALLGALIVAGCVGTPYGTSDAAPDFHALVASPDRSAADRDEDVRRRPEPLLAFTGVRPGMKVLEIGAGDGYTAELLARAVGPQGVVYAQNAAPREKFDARMKTPAMKKVVPLTRPFDDPAPPEVKDLDLITVILIYHDITYLPVNRLKMDRRFFELLKPGGHLVVVDHAAKPGAGASVGKTLHRIEEPVLRHEVEAVGFRLEAEGDFLHNPDDPREEPFFRMKMPTDRFALKFVKP